MERHIVACGCCGYTSDVYVHFLSSGIVTGRVICGPCSGHMVWAMRIVHTIVAHWYVRRLPKD